jgi:FkbM family methyltransferase
MKLEQIIRKIGRTAQVRIPMIREIGKWAEHKLRLLTRTAHDPELEGLRLISVPPGALFADIGANRGWATHSFRILHPHVRIHAFEPNPGMADRIAHLYRPPDALHAVALSDRMGEFPLYIPVYRGLAFDGLASLSEEEARRWLNAETLFGFDPGRLEVRAVACPVATLDSFGIRPFFMKIDVQGFELEVISGGLGTIAASEPIIFAESETLDVTEALRLLAGWDYSVFRFDGRFHRGETSRRNVYFLPASKIGLLPAG